VKPGSAQWYNNEHFHILEKIRTYLILFPTGLHLPADVSVFEILKRKRRYAYIPELE
jgi:hypothetical protein